MKSLKSVFVVVDVAGKTTLERILEFSIRRVGRNGLNFLAKKIKLIGLIEETRTDEDTIVTLREGLLQKIYYCSDGYFQSEILQENVIKTLEIRHELLIKASATLKKLPKERSSTFFVHIRRGDYTYWPSRNEPAVLPLRWFQEQMNLIRSEYANVHFVVVSDDWPYVEEMFKSETDVFISHENEGVDFALMTLCDGGILSASSFAWWGAYFARRNNNNKYFIAPMYWIGHSTNNWYPQGIETSWLKYAPVNKEEEFSLRK